MANITTTELILRTRQRADLQNSKHVSDSEIITHLNDEIADLYARACNVDDGKLFATVSPTVTQIGNNAYQLPSDFMRLVSVDIYDGGNWTPAYPATPQEYLNLLSISTATPYAAKYYLHLNQDQGWYELFLFPAQDVDDIGVRYLPEAPRLSVGTDTLKWPSNWHEPVILGTAIKCLNKEESDTTALLIKQEQLIERMLKDVRTQEVSEVVTLKDLTSRNRRRAKRLWGW